jgi:hypothetical protein
MKMCECANAIASLSVYIFRIHSLHPSVKFVWKVEGSYSVQMRAEEFAICRLHLHTGDSLEFENSYSEMRTVK